MTRRQILALLTFLEDEPLTLARVELEDMLRELLEEAPHAVDVGPS